MNPSSPFIDIAADMFPVERLLRWERERSRKLFLTEPLGGGAVLEITWGQAATEVRRMAAYLRAQNWPDGSRIAIYGENSAHWVLADLAIWMAGYVSVPVDTSFGANTLSHVLRHSEARACFVGRLIDTSALLRGLPGYLPIISMSQAPNIAAELSSDFAMTLPEGPASQMFNNSWNSIVARTEPMRRVPPTDGNGLATVVYSAGSSDEPNGAMHTFHGLAWTARAVTQRFPLSADDRLVSCLPLTNLTARMLPEYAALLQGSQIFFAESADTRGEDMKRAQPTVYLASPDGFAELQQAVHADLPADKLQKHLRTPVLGYLMRNKALRATGLDQCRLALCSMAPLPVALLHWFRELGLDLIEVYGTAESGGITHSTPPGQAPAIPDAGSVRQPLAGVLHRLDAQTGELQIQSPGQMQGYFNGTASSQGGIAADGWLRTGDTGTIDATGTLRIIARAA